jgi:hypothetical protein
LVHPKWDERPLLVVVRNEGCSVTREELLAYYDGKVRSGGFPTMSPLSMSCRTQRPASC